MKRGLLISHAGGEPKSPPTGPPPGSVDLQPEPPQRHVACEWADTLPKPGFGGGESGLGPSCSWSRAAAHPNLASDQLSLGLRISPSLCSSLRGLMKVREPRADSIVVSRTPALVSSQRSCDHMDHHYASSPWPHTTQAVSFRFTANISIFACKHVYTF